VVSLEEPSFAIVMCFKIEKHSAKLPTPYVYKNTQNNHRKAISALC